MQTSPQQYQPLVSIIADMGLADTLVFYQLAKKLQRSGIRCRLYCNYLHELGPLISYHEDLQLELLCHAPCYSGESNDDAKMEIYQNKEFSSSVRNKAGYMQLKRSSCSFFPPVQNVQFTLSVTGNGSWVKTVETFLWEEFSIAMETQSLFQIPESWTKAPKQIALCPYSSDCSVDADLFRLIAQGLQKRGYNPLFFVPRIYLEEAQELFAGFPVASIPLADLAEHLHSSQRVITTSKAIALLTHELGQASVCLIDSNSCNKRRWISFEKGLCRVLGRGYNLLYRFLGPQLAARYLIYKAGL